MADELNIRSRVERIRSVLSLSKNGILAGSLPPGKTVTGVSLTFLPDPLVQLYNATDGPMCGVVDIWRSEELAGNQFLIQDLHDPNLYCFGQAIYVPLVVNLKTSEVFLCDYEEEGSRLPVAKVESFISDYLLGANYSCLFRGDEDNWCKILKSVGVEQSEDRISIWPADAG